MPRREHVLVLAEFIKRPQADQIGATGISIVQINFYSSISLESVTLSVPGYCEGALKYFFALCDYAIILRGVGTTSLYAVAQPKPVAT